MENPARLGMFESRVCESKGLGVLGPLILTYFESQVGNAPGGWLTERVQRSGVALGWSSELLGGLAT